LYRDKSEELIVDPILVGPVYLPLGEIDGKKGKREKCCQRKDCGIENTTGLPEKIEAIILNSFFPQPLIKPIDLYSEPNRRKISQQIRLKISG